MNKKAFIIAAPYFVIAGIALFMFQGILAQGFMSGFDNSFHYYDAYYLATTLIPQYHWISGWNMQAMAGMPVFVDYYQTGFFMVAALNKILCLPLNISYKFMVLFSYAFFGFGFYKLSLYRFGRAPALIMTCCFMLQKNIYLDKILAGMWNNYLAIGALFIFLHLLDKYNKDMTFKQAAILGLLLSAVILTHIFVAIFAFVILMIYFGLSVIKLSGKSIFNKTAVYAYTAFSAFALSAYYLYSFIVSRDYFFKFSHKDLVAGLVWGLKSFVGPLEILPDIFSAAFLNIPVLIRIFFGFFGITFFFLKEKNAGLKRFLSAVCVFIIAAFCLFTDVFPNIFSWWGSIPFVSNLQTSRFCIYIQVGMYIFAAYGLSVFLEYIYRKKIFLTLLALVISGSLVCQYVYFAREGSKTLEQSPNMKYIYKVWDWINNNVPAGEGRITYQNTVGNMSDQLLNRSDVFALSGIFTKSAEIGVSRSASPFPQEQYMRNAHGEIFSRPVSETDGFYIKTMMKDFNSGYIVTVEKNLADKLKNSRLFINEAAFGDFNIFHLAEFKDEIAEFEKNAAYKITSFGDQNIVLDIENKSENNSIFLKIAYHPFWKAALNGNSVKIEQNIYSFMKISLPEKGRYQLMLKFDCFRPFWITFSFLSLLISLALIFRPVNVVNVVYE